MRRQIVMLVDAWDIAILKVMMNRLIFVRDVRNIQATEKDGEIEMTEQEKWEKVIKGLECCILGNKHEPDCDVCPYSAGYNDTCDTMDEIHGDALSLLKAQEPRLVTEADFENADPYGYLPVWVEDKDDNEIICDCITKHAITEPDEDYHYRYWTSKPTDEQREAIPWE